MYGGYGSTSSLYGNLYGSSSSSSSLDSLMSAANSANTAASWAVPVFWISLVAAILIFFLFLAKKNEGKFKGFALWLYDFLSFKKLLAEALLKITYIALALYVTIMSFAFIGSSFGQFLIMLIGGNLLIRVIYEIAILLLVICRNTTEINKKMANKDEEK